MKKTAIYIHIPFCDHKCIYCDFYSLVSYENQEQYLSSLKKEISHYSGLYSANREISSIFFGGGTPSYMDPKYIEEIISQVSRNFNLSSNIEITLETNPGTVNQQLLGDFRSIGINRMSIGIQSFDESELKFLTRIHDKKSAIQTVEDAAKAGFENLSIDLIFSLPNQSKKIWQDNLSIASSLPIKHISAYSLILERGTILNKMVLDGKVKMNTENHDADLYEYTMEYLEEKKYVQYEISNFAKVGYECVHNQYYWQYNDYLGFGTAAHSFINGIRWWNYSSLKKYIDEINSNGHAQRGSEKLEKFQMLDEIVMLGLRSEGIDLDQINKYSKEWYIKNSKLIDNFIADGYLIESNEKIRCTRKGYKICDELVNKLL